jgi:hypothetical protein
VAERQQTVVATKTSSPDFKSGGDGGSRAATMLGFTPAGNHALQLLVPTITMRVPPRHRVPVLHRLMEETFSNFFV